MSIKMSVLRSSLHKNLELDGKNQLFINKLEAGLNEKIITTSIDDYDCDLKLIFIESGGSEGLFLENLDKLEEPYYLLTNGDNNSLAASLEILTYCNLHQKQGEVLHGSNDYLVSRIKEIYQVNKTLKTLKNLKLGVIGKPSDWLISSLPDEANLKAKFGISLKNILIEELILTYEKTKISEYQEDFKLEFNKESLDSAKRMYVAIKKLKDKYELDGLTIRCFDLLSTCKTTSCLGFAILNSQGIISTCEGDIMSMVGMAFIKSLFNEEAFQANPSRIDLISKEITFAHCTIPFSMVQSYNLDTHFESGIGVGIKGVLPLMPVTILRISSDLKHYFVRDAEILRNLNETNLCRTQIVVKVKDDISSLLKNPCGNHHLIFYKHHQKEVMDVLNSLGLKAL